MTVKRRRLTDLYQVGKPLVFGEDDGDSEAVEVWLHKPNDVEQETIFRRANAAKIKLLKRAANPDSDEFQDALDVVCSLEDDTITNLALAEEFQKARARIEAQLATDEDGEWAKDDHYQSLFDLWRGDDENEGLERRYALDPEDPEANEVLAELQRFNEQVAEAFEVEQAALLRQAAARPRSEIEAEAAKRFMATQTDDIFMKEYERQYAFYSVREPDDHRARYFERIEEIDELADVVRQRIYAELRLIMLEVGEGKGSPATPAGSASSEPTETVELSQDSGLVDAPA